VLLATLLAALSVVRVSLNEGRPEFRYRQHLVWSAQETLLISQAGFLEGRTTVPPDADPSRLAGLSAYYAQLANSDAIQSRIPLISKDMPLPLVVAAPVTSYVGSSATLLPMLTFTGEASTASQAIEVTRTASNAFRSYLAQQQTKAAIPKHERVVISVLNMPVQAKVAEPRKKTIPLMVFLAVMAATVGLALILENVRPRAAAVRPAQIQKRPGQRQTRSSIVGVRRSGARR
jgi:hypothetical protein